MSDSPLLAPPAHLAALEAASDRLAERAAPNLDRPVEACPDWNVGDLLGHLGGVYSWAAAVVAAGGSRPDFGGETPPERAALIRWFVEQRDRLVESLSSHALDQPAWTFVRKEPADVAWWYRRQAQETALHAWDVDRAAGAADPIPADLAADGVDEVLTELLPGYLRRRPVTGLGGTLHLHATDTPGEWSLDLAAPDLVRREHGKADTALRGPASGLLLWVWNRMSPEEASLEVFGSHEVVAAWSEIRL